MLKTKWNHLLRSLGMSDSEVQVYLSALDLGPSSVQDLAKKANVSRVTAYAVIEHLIQRNLMSSVEKGKKHVFTAESPERLVAVMTTRLHDMKATLHEVEDGIHELKLIQRGEKPIVKMFEGEDAFSAVFEDIAATRPTELDEFGNFDEVRKHVSRETSVKQLERGLKNAKRRLIYTSSLLKTAPIEEGKHFAAFLPEDENTSLGDVLIYGKNKVALSSLGPKPVSVIIESEVITQMMRSLFTLAWKHVKK